MDESTKPGTPPVNSIWRARDGRTLRIREHCENYVCLDVLPPYAHRQRRTSQMGYENFHNGFLTKEADFE